MRFLSDEKTTLISDWIDLVCESEDDQDDKENLTGKKPATVEELEQHSLFTSKQPQTISRDVRIWDMPIKERLLQVRRFQNHKVDPIVHQKGQPTLIENLSCPKSASSDAIADRHLINHKSLRISCMRHRYMRRQRDGVVEYQCRMCCAKRWVPKDLYDDHMTMVHGLMSLSNPKDVLVLPTPSRLFCLYLHDGMKRYHCQCPNCNSWIRLGFPEVPYTNQTLTPDERIRYGLYSNYFLHFMDCYVKSQFGQNI